MMITFFFKYEPEANGICHLQHPQHHPHQHPQQQTFHSSPVKSPAKGVGPKIVAVTSPRPLIVQVQSLTQPPMNQGLDSTNDVNDIPNGNIALQERKFLRSGKKTKQIIDCQTLIG
jgi:hypothetical protein